MEDNYTQGIDLESMDFILLVSLARSDSNKLRVGGDAVGIVFL